MYIQKLLNCIYCFYFKLEVKEEKRQLQAIMQALHNNQNENVVRSIIKKYSNNEF